MNLPMYMLLKKMEEYMESHNKYDNRYRKLQSRSLDGFDRERDLKYYRDMRGVYEKKCREITIIIRKVARRF
jgi:hypothetical protein